jgi:uncharacterized protein YcnI
MNRLRRGVVASVIGAGVLVFGAAPAWAHVTVNPNEAAQGGFAKLTFRVPNETDSANTIKLDVQIPIDPPLASVSVQPKAGWTAEVKKSPLTTPVTDDDGNTVTEAVSEIIWSGGQIKPGEFDEFNISVGPLPDKDSMTFNAIQSYDDGTDVKWIEAAVQGQPEPEHPAPVLKLTAAASADHSSPSSSSSSEAAAPATQTVVKKETNNGLAVVAIVIAAIALIAAIGGLARRRAS